MITKFKLFESSNIVTELNYSYKNLTELPKLPDTLKKLMCYMSHSLASITLIPIFSFVDYKTKDGQYT